MTEFVEIPSGTFLMGENPDDKFTNDTERPRHEVRVKAFLLAVTPVTVREFRKFSPGHEPSCAEDWPVASVTWEEAAAYAHFCVCRLPSEAEWEYAARAGAATPFPWGDTITPAQANFYYEENGNRIGLGHRTPVGAYPANGFGVCDVVGNVCEWTADVWHSGYDGAPADGSASSDGGRAGWRVLRGGAWDYLPRLLRVSWRDALPQTSRRDNVGFRLARDLSNTDQ